MDTNKRSKRVARKKTPEEKEAEADRYRVDKKELISICKEVENQQKAMFELNRAFGGIEKQESLQFTFTDDNSGATRQFVVSHNDLKALNAQCNKEIANMKKYVVGVRRRKKPANGYSNVRVPIVVSPVLISFINEANFGPMDPSSCFVETADSTGKKSAHYDVKMAARQTQLSSQLELAKKGYMLRNALNRLMLIHVYAEGLQHEENQSFISSSAIMDKVFGGDKPAYYDMVITGEQRTTRADGSEKVEKTTEKVPNDNRLNTYQVAQKVHSDFDPKSFQMFWLQSLTAPNVIGRNELNDNQPEIISFLNDPGTLGCLGREHDLIASVGDSWKNLRAPGQKSRREAKKKAKDAEKKGRTEEA